METQTLHDVPPEDLDQVVADFTSEGYTVTTQKQGNGNFTVVATRRRKRGAEMPTEANTIALHNVKKSEVGEIVADLTSEGYRVSVEPEPDGEFTVFAVNHTSA